MHMILLTGILLFTPAALADNGPSAPPAPADAPLRKQDSNLDFNLLSEPAKNPATTAPSAELVYEVAHRRRMLQLHQALGFATLASLAATDIVGQLNLNDKYGGGGVTNQYELLHIGLATLTLGLFTSVAALGIFAPTPYPKPLQWDTALVHKLFMSVAALGMLTQVVLGILASAHEGSVSQTNFVTWHQVSGYVSLGAMAGGATVLLF